METLIFLLVILSTNLVFSDDNVAIESGVGYQVHAPPEETDQQAESSQVVSHTYGQSGQGANSKDVRAVRQSHEETLKYSDVSHLNRNDDVGYTLVQNVHDQPEQQTVQYLHENIRHRPIVVNGGGGGGGGGVHSVENQAYLHQEQETGVQQYPTHQVQIYNAQASPLQQVYENERTIGYQTYVEHVPEAEDEEIKSALKENSLGDIKRLVPKSGISFKIYHNEKAPNVKMTEHKVETPPDVSTISAHATQKEFLNSVLHHRVRIEAPVQQLQIQTSQMHQLPELDKPQQIYVQPSIDEHQSFGDQLPVGNVLHEGENLKSQLYYTQPEVSSPRSIVYTQPEVSSPRPALEIPGKGIADPLYKIKLRDDHVRATSTVEFNKNAGSGGFRQDTGHLRHQHSRKNFHKTFKQLKPENVHYQNELVEGMQKLAVSHNEGLGSFIPHAEVNLYAGGLKNSCNVIGHQVMPQDQFLHSKTFADSKTGQPILNRLSGSYINEGIKPGAVVNHLGTSAYAEAQYKNTQSNFGSTYPDNEGAKTQHSPINHGTQFEGNSSPNNFDHQKALEGSTSFDIKNAIGNTEGVETQKGYVSTTEIHPTEQVQKQQLLYSLPSVLIDNGILKGPVEGHQIKTVGQVTSIPQFAYHPQEIGKFYRQPQFLWTSEHFKQGNELHQPLIKLHVPKEEIQYVKTPKVEIPNVITHQHQPFISHQNVPYKSHGLYFHVKKHPQGYQTNLKPAIQSQPVIIDWSLFKSKFPNVNINSLTVKPELISYIQDPTKKIMPILIKKRKNRSNNKELGVVYGKATNKGPAKPNQRQEKNVRVNLVPSATNDVKQYEGKSEGKNEFSVSASYKVDRSYKSSS